jgi:energy-coupling factor transporter transmembrane protein EcfT
VIGRHAASQVSQLRQVSAHEPQVSSVGPLAVPKFSSCVRAASVRMVSLESRSRWASMSTTSREGQKPVAQWTRPSC